METSLPPILERCWHLRNDLPALADFSEQAQACLTAARLDPAALSAVLLVLDEMLTNVIKYAHPGEAPGGRVIPVTLRVDADEVRIEIEDDGRPFDPVAAVTGAAPEPTEDVPLEERAIGGWGLPLVHKMVDSVRYQRMDGRNRVSMHKRLPRRPPALPL